jgi:SAM-dependent methyltransferase
MDTSDRSPTALPAPTRTEADALARLYDLDLVEDPGDLDLYLALAARTGGPILELAVGTGRLAVPLAEQGHRVTGVDLDPAMLARARTRAAAATAAGAARASGASGGAIGDLRFEVGDARSVRLPDAGRYRLAFLALNSLFIMGGRQDQQAVVATLAAHLAPGGLAVVDVWLPDADDLARYDGRVMLEYPRRDPTTGRHVVKIGSAIHDAATSTVQLTTIYEEGEPGEPAVRWIRRDAMRLVGADELRAFAESAGLIVESIAGGYDMEPFGRGADRAILIAARP